LTRQIVVLVVVVVVVVAVVVVVVVVDDDVDSKRIHCIDLCIITSLIFEETLPLLLLDRTLSSVSVVETL